MKSIKPIYLFADSQLLFLKNEQQEYYLKSLLIKLECELSKAVYIGISNGNIPEFYGLFVEAMNIIGITECRMITSILDAEERRFLDEADIVLLSGGDTELGLKGFKETGIGEVIKHKYQKGAIIIGISAGAIQLGFSSFYKTEGKYSTTQALRLLPFIILVHQSDSKEEIKARLKASETMKRAYEIPFGAGMIYYPDQTLEAIRRPINEYLLDDNRLIHTLIVPPSIR